VHWARTAEEARDAVLGICRAAGAKTVTKGKSMIAEEIGLDEHLERHGIAPIDTDLGEYIIQLRGEAPSHLIAPAIHLVREQVAETFRAAHPDLDRRDNSVNHGSFATKHGAFCATGSWRRRSASPAPISSSPRPGRALSSRTKAMAI
jgi:L-lactate utilization protein LutB